MNNLPQILHDPNLTTIDQDGCLNVDLLAIAVRSGAPLTVTSIQKISLMVQRQFREIYPDAECHVRIANQVDRTQDRLIVPNFEP